LEGITLGTADQRDSNAKTLLTPAIEAKDISHSFGAVQALVNANISVSAGEVKAIVGDNGAGKSTLLKVLSGLVIPDKGEIFMDGKGISFSSPVDALKSGIQTVYQDLALIDTMSATQNVFVGREELSSNWVLKKLGIVNDRYMHQEAIKVLSDLGIKIPSLNATVRSMSGGQRQCLAIARAMLFGHKVIILDEPTAALGVHESAQVLSVVDQLRTKGLAILIVSHNMQHVFKITDSITVMRLGTSVASRKTNETSPEEIVGLITGAISG
jgi:ABC-type sugar transport system ATPase subunit